MSKSLLEILFDNLFDGISDALGLDTPEWIGKHGEKLTEKELKFVKFMGKKGLTLKNIYVPKDNGETSEIDVVYITQKGIFVIESKNYSGWIFGSDNSYYWTAMLPNKEKNKFYNPILQNKTHIKWLSNYLEEDIPLFSLIVFSERCEIKKAPEKTPYVRVLKRDRIYAHIREIWESSEDKLSEEKINEIYEKLKILTNADESIKQAHIKDIERKYQKPIKQEEFFSLQEQKPIINSSNQSDSPISNETVEEIPSENDDITKEKLCPKCGSKLVLRTAKKGENAGKQFYGCSAFPKCRHIEN